MEASSWNSEPCQIVPNSRFHHTNVDMKTNTVVPMASSPYSSCCSSGGGSVDQDSDYDLHSYYDEFDNFGGLSFDELFDNLVEKSKEESSSMNKEHQQNHQVKVQVKTENVSVQDSSTCCTLGHQDSFEGTKSEICRTVPLPGFSFPTDPAGDGMELYHDLIMRHLIQDIQATSNRLKISSDPRCWTVENTQRWLSDTSYQYKLPPPPFELMNTPGSTLCATELETLRQLYPAGAELIHAQLNLWTTASDYNARCAEVLHQPYLPIKINPEDNFESLWPVFNLKVCQGPTQASYFSQMKKENPWCNPFPFPLNPEFATVLTSPGTDSGIPMNEIDQTGEVYPFRHQVAPFPSVHHYHSNNIHLWQFLRELLDHQEKYAYCVRWIDRTQGIFKIEDSHKLAKLWGQRKNRPAMNYDKLSRSLRQYYRKGILKKTARSQRLVYQFLSPFHIC